MVEGCHETDRGVTREQKGEGDETACCNQREGNSRAGNGHVAQIVRQIVRVRSLAVVRLRVEVKVGRQREQVNARVLLEELLFGSVSWEGMEWLECRYRLAEGSMATLAAPIVKEPKDIRLGGSEQFEGKRQDLAHCDE